MREKIKLLNLALLLVFVSAEKVSANSANGPCGSLVRVTCDGGGSKIEFVGTDVTDKVDCGASTPPGNGKISDNHNCVGSAFPCMRGKECVQAEPLSKDGKVFHMPNCGSGGQPTGGILGAGCIHVSQEILTKLKSCIGTPYQVRTNAAASNGR